MRAHTSIARNMPRSPSSGHLSRAVIYRPPFHLRIVSRNGYAHRTVKLSAQERERRRQVALRLHREGRLGTKTHQSQGGKAKARKASELAQRLVQDNEAAIERTLREVLKSGTKAQ